MCLQKRKVMCQYMCLRVHAICIYMCTSVCIYVYVRTCVYLYVYSTYVCIGYVYMYSMYGYMCAS